MACRISLFTLVGVSVDKTVSCLKVFIMYRRMG